MASMMTAVVLGGILVKHSTQSFRRFENTAWLVLASEPSHVARDHGVKEICEPASQSVSHVSHVSRAIHASHASHASHSTNVKNFYLLYLPSHENKNKSSWVFLKGKCM